jgi:hypothetical protein
VYFVCIVLFRHVIIIEVRFKQNIRTNKWNHTIEINHQKFHILNKRTFVELLFIAITLQAQEKIFQAFHSEIFVILYMQ